jgi:TatD DNase family protein
MILRDKTKSEADLLKSLKYNNIEYALQVSVEERDFIWSRDFAKRHYEDGIFYTLGIHPSSQAAEKELKILSDLTDSEMKGKFDKLLFGIGECGLDYYRMHQPKEMQRNSFETQIDIAKKHKLPIIIHCRDAMVETIQILKDKKCNYGIMHCFAGDSKAAKLVLDMGFVLSFAGNVTYKKAVELHDAVKYVPLDRLLLETDSPFLTPEPERGKSNLPEMVKHTYKFVANYKKISLPKLEESITENFVRLIRK